MTTTARPHPGTRARAVLALCGAVAVGATATACGSDVSHAPVREHTFAFSGRKLTVDADDSGVRVVPGDVTGVRVRRQVGGWVFLGSGPDASWRLAGDTLTLRVTCSGLAADCDARHTVTVPRDVAVTVRSGNGAVTASGFRTAVSVRTSNGSAEVRDSSGPVSLSSRNGSVTGTGLTGGKATARSSNGAVSLGFSTVPDDVEAVSHNGRIRISLPKGRTAYAVDAGSGNGRTDVGVPRDDASPHAVKAHAANGGVSVRAAN
ncbi:DUF4097 family beta strand repeat-containing protein [Streptomyces tremellae]|uniref:DUF4097 family beta strand repeat-containing protein n=1 Tax=Streptomyces tremellae TaxID=1124239 RepID=UPI0031E80F44